jgi:hypothetical protein
MALWTWREDSRHHLKRRARTDDGLRVMAIHPTVALGQPIRNERRTAFLAGYAFLFALSMLGVGAIVDARFGTREPLEAGGATVFFAALAFVAVWLGNRMRQASLRINVDAVVVKNVVRSHDVPLDAVARFEPGNTTPGGNPTPGIVLVLRDGRSIPVWALAVESSVFSARRKIERFAPLAVQLNSLLDSARTP